MLIIITNIVIGRRVDAMYYHRIPDFLFLNVRNINQLVRKKKKIQPNQIAMGLLNFNSADAKGHLQNPDIDVINMKLHDDIIIIITIIVVNLHKT